MLKCTQLHFTLLFYIINLTETCVIVIVLLGSGVFAEKAFTKGSFLLEYRGELISKQNGEEREEAYKKERRGCFLYFFKSGSRNLW